MVRLSAFADEASSSLSGQIEALKRNGIGYIEIRGINGTNISNITEEDARVYAKQLSDAGIKVWSIGSPVGKIKLGDYSLEYKEKVRHIARLAKIFGTDKIRMFSFYDAYENEAGVFEALSELVKLAKEEGVTLCHENEKQIYGDKVERIVRLKNCVGGMAYVFDPANFIEVGEDIGVALDTLFDITEYFHIKDAIYETGEIVPAGYGDGRLAELVSRLPQDRDIVLSIEPHLAVFSGYSEIDNTEMKNKFCYENNDRAFDAAAEAIKKLLTEAGYREKDGGFSK